MQSETDFPSSHQLKSCVAYKCRLKLAARAVLSADAGLHRSSIRYLPQQKFANFNEFSEIKKFVKIGKKNSLNARHVPG